MSRDHLRWSSLRRIQSSRLIQITVSIPLVGYFILFNDAVAAELTFETLTADEMWGLSAKARLQFTYFGLIVLAASAICYRAFCPKEIQAFADEESYKRDCDGNISLSEFLSVHKGLSEPLEYWEKNADNNPINPIKDMAVAGLDNKDPYKSIEHEDWSQLAKRIKHYDAAFSAAPEFYADVLKRWYEEQDCRNELAATITFLLTLLGLALLLVPSGELFVRVLVSTLRDLV